MARTSVWRDVEVIAWAKETGNVTKQYRAGADSGINKLTALASE